MRSLAVYLKNYKKESILAPFFKFLEVVFDLIVPIVIAQIIDVGIANHDNGYIVQRFSILILMALVLAIICAASAVVGGIIAGLISRKIGKPIKLCAERIEKLSEGDLTSPDRKSVV